MFDTQMEMSFEAGGVRFSQRQRRVPRAQWWFQRMRQVVDRAIDWQSVPQCRPEQMWFANTYRQPQTGGQLQEKSNSEAIERQICE